jgi:putative nucleotidyltransferase with HDIG domain
LEALAESVPAVEQLDPLTDWGVLPERFRLHAVGVASVVDRLFDEGVEANHELVTGALLHDVGELALYRTHADFPAAAADDQTPEERLAAEREMFGIDHAAAGGRIARAWHLPQRAVAMIEEHHTAVDGEAAVIRLADMLVSYSQGRLIDLETLVSVAANVGLEREHLGNFLYELPRPAFPRSRERTLCPLSKRELQVLSRLAQGKLPKQIAADLGLAASTIRNHLHRIYMRMGVADRAQAVLVAREHGWI